MRGRAFLYSGSRLSIPPTQPSVLRFASGLHYIRGMSQPVSFRFPEPLVALLKQRAEADGTSVNATVVATLFRGLSMADESDSLEGWREGAERRLSRLEEMAGL